MKSPTWCALAIALMIAGCASVRPADLDAWVGQPVSALDTQPFFLTLPVVKTMTPEGIEIRNYVNGMDTASCSGFGSSYVNYSSWSTTQSCVAQFRACNNIFYIRDGRVLSYRPTPSGGARCATDARVRPTKVF